MSLLANAKGLETKDTDFLGGKLSTDVYLAAVKMMYIDKNERGTVFANIELVLKTANGTRNYNETIYMSNSKGEFTFIDKKTNKPTPLPGFVTVDTLCKMATGKGVNEQETARKTIEVYDPKTKGKVNAEKEVVMSMLKQKVQVAIVQEVHNKNAKDASGDYVPTAETFTSTTIKKVFNAEGLTQTEVDAGKSEGEFKDAWLKANKDKVFDKTVKVANGATAGGVAKSTSKPEVDISFD